MGKYLSSSWNAGNCSAEWAHVMKGVMQCYYCTRICSTCRRGTVFCICFMMITLCSRRWAHTDVAVDIGTVGSGGLSGCPSMITLAPGGRNTARKDELPSVVINTVVCIKISSCVRHGNFTNLTLSTCQRVGVGG